MLNKDLTQVTLLLQMTTNLYPRKLLYGLIAISLSLTACTKDNIVIQPAQEYVIPLTISYANNSVTPVVTININGESRQVIFDTGSAGLRIVSGAVDPATLEPHEDTLRYIYGAGSNKLITKGNLAGAYFSLEPAMGTSSIRFMLIDSLGRSTDGILHSIDPSETTDANFRGYSGVLGVGLEYNNDGAADPIAQLPGNGKYIVEFPAYGQTNGKVIINPCGSDLSGFAMFNVPLGNYLIPNGDNSWNDHDLHGQVVLNGVSLTNGILFDTGTPQIVLTTNLIPSGTAENGTFSYGLIPQGDTEPSFQSKFTITEQKAGVDLVQIIPVGPQDPASTNLGTRVFFDYDVLYDQVSGKIGVRKK